MEYELYSGLSKHIFNDLSWVHSWEVLSCGLERLGHVATLKLGTSVRRKICLFNPQLYGSCSMSLTHSLTTSSALQRLRPCHSNVALPFVMRKSMSVRRGVRFRHVIVISPAHEGRGDGSPPPPLLPPSILRHAPGPVGIVCECVCMCRAAVLVTLPCAVDG